jgi:hypothetical protein
MFCALLGLCALTSIVGVRRSGLALSIALTEVRSNFTRRENPVAETLCASNGKYEMYRNTIISLIHYHHTLLEVMNCLVNWNGTYVYIYINQTRKIESRYMWKLYLHGCDMPITFFIEILGNPEMYYN